MEEITEHIPAAVRKTEMSFNGKLESERLQQRTLVREIGKVRPDDKLRPDHGGPSRASPWPFSMPLSEEDVTGPSRRVHSTGLSRQPLTTDRSGLQDEVHFLVPSPATSSDSTHGQWESLSETQMNGEDMRPQTSPFPSVSAFPNPVSKAQGENIGLGILGVTRAFQYGH